MKYDAMKHQGSKGEKYTADMVGEAAGTVENRTEVYPSGGIIRCFAGICGQ